MIFDSLFSIYFISLFNLSAGFSKLNSLNQRVLHFRVEWSPLYLKYNLVYGLFYKIIIEAHIMGINHNDVVSVVFIFAIFFIMSLFLRYIIHKVIRVNSIKYLVSGFILLIISSVISYIASHEILHSFLYLELTSAAISVVKNGFYTSWWFFLSLNINLWITGYFWGINEQHKETCRIPRLHMRVLGGIVSSVMAMACLYMVYDKSAFALVTASGVVVVVIGYGAQHVIGQFFSGLSLNLESNILIGDKIKIGEHIGNVLDMDWRSVTIIDIFDNLIIFPNNFITNAKVINMSRPTSAQRIKIELLINYNVSPDRVKALVHDVAVNVSERIPGSDISVLFTKFTDTAAIYNLIFHIDARGGVSGVKDKVFTSLWAILVKEAIPLQPERVIVVKNKK